MAKERDMDRLYFGDAWERGECYDACVVVTHVDGLEKGDENIDVDEVSTGKGNPRLWALKIRRPELRVYFSDVEDDVLCLLFVGGKDSQQRDIQSALAMLKEMNEEEGVIKEERVVRQEQDIDIAKETYAVPVVPTSPFVIEEWLDAEIKRKFFIEVTFDDDLDMERAKETVRVSREYHGHKIPDPEFFGY